MTERKQFAPEPVDGKDPTSPWLTGKPRAIKAVKNVLGHSDYVAHEGLNTGGANGIYWVDIIDRSPGGLMVISNMTKGAKREVESVQMAIEPDLLYPLLRGRDVKRWQAEPSSYVLMAQDPAKRRGIDEDEMKTDYPKTYLYLKRFEIKLRERAAYKRYFRSDDPFYSMFNAGDYTMTPHKVVWRYISTEFTCAVISDCEDENLDRKIIIPDHRLIIVSLKEKDESHYVCAMLNSSLSRFIVQNYVVGTQISTHVLQHVRVPKFDPTNNTHPELVGLSQNAHYATEMGDEVGVKELEQRIDELAAQIWGLTTEELAEIKSSLEEMA